MTAPTSRPPNCLLWIDGVRYADGQPSEPDSEPVALDGLEVRWGRTNSLDQPSPATAEFEVLDMPGGARFLDRLHVGARVEITASATIYPDPTVPTITNAGFENLAVGATPSTIRNNGTVVGVAAPVHAGTRAVRVDPVDPTRAVEIMFPPAPFSANISAWDAVPRTVNGQRWEFGASVQLSQWSTAQQQVTVQPVAFTSPTGEAHTITVLPDRVNTVPGAGGWQNLRAGFIPPDGIWLGLRVRVYPTGPRWNEIPPAMTWGSMVATPNWEQLSEIFVDDLLMLAPAAGAARSGSVFAGRITDMAAEWDADKGGTLVTVTAQDDLAELANRYVGAAPWAAEPLNTRFSRVVAESAQSINWSVDPTVRDIPVTYRDVDNQPAAALLQELARSVAGALWEATSLVTGPFLRLEDVNSRAALLLLGMGLDGFVHITVAPDAAGRSITLSACDVLLEPVRWEQDATDASTRVATLWQEQTVDDGVIKPTQREHLVIDGPLEVATGQRRVSVSTELSREADAVVTGSAYLARLAQPGWRISGITIDLLTETQLSPELLADVMTILDGTTRIGLGLIVTDIPDWAPNGSGDRALYLEGVRLTNTAGAWVIELVTTGAVGQGQAAVTWAGLPVDWSWLEFGPEVDWDDLYGVALGAP